MGPSSRDVPVLAPPWCEDCTGRTPPGPRPWMATSGDQGRLHPMYLDSRALGAPPRSGVVLGTALTLLLAGTSQAQAAAAGGALYADGLHSSTAALVDPAGKTWVADHNAGFCRVTDPSATGPGRIEHPERPGQTGTRTCLGG